MKKTKPKPKMIKIARVERDHDFCQWEVFIGDKCLTMPLGTPRNEAVSLARDINIAAYEAYAGKGRK